MIKATVEDLKKELWIRQRNSGEIQWKDSQGVFTSIANLSTEHIINIINKQQKIQANSIEIKPESFNFY